MKTALLIFVLFAVGCGDCGNGDAPKNARKWAETHFTSNFSAIECMPRDSDGDGYVSCTIFFKSEPPMGIECATGYIGDGCGNKGCRLASGKSR